MGQLSLALIGRPRVSHAGADLAFPTRKTLALLVYLAVEGSVQSREKLAALLWPETTRKGPGHLSAIRWRL